MDRIVKTGQLKSICVALLEAVNVPKEEAEIISDSLVVADQRGVNSHGVVSLGRYIGLIKKGVMPPSAQWKVERDSGVISVWDGMHCSGQVLGTRAMEEAIKRCRKYGIALIGVRRSSHFGAGAYYSMLAQAQGMIGITCSTGSPTMAPWGGAERLIGNNPLAVAMPAGQGDPLVLDMAQSAVAFGKIMNLKLQQKKEIPKGWALDEFGEETFDIDKAYSAMPVGGYKGFGLALVLDVLSGILFGGATGERAGDNAEGPSQLFIALDIGKFNDLGLYTIAMESRIDELRKCRPARGSKGVLMPGEIEMSKYRDNIESLSLFAEAVDGLNKLADELGVQERL